MEKKKSEWVKRALALVGALVTSFALSVGPAAATSSSTDSFKFAWQPLTHSGFGPNGEFHTFPKTLPSPDPSATRLLDPINIGLCNIGTPNLTLMDFLSKSDGLIRLTCGNGNGGYVHIRKKHEAEWQATTPKYRLWDDYMSWAVSGILKFPAVRQVQDHMKRCYSAPVQLGNYMEGKFVPFKTINPTVIVSINNKVVVTAYPSKVSSCR